ncbi:transposase [Candidatus Gottesmanbacteria bacterium]|nr:transposase [Candidatus Gottesmanbacteria bacterium]
MATKRNVVFANEEIYHVFNRGVERRSLFGGVREYQRFVDTLWFYRFINLPTRLSGFFSLPTAGRQACAAKLRKEHQVSVALLAYCLMPNHFHLVVKQQGDQGISTFLANISNSYTKYFNTKHKRVGSLLQGPFKAVHMESDEQFLHVVRYVHLNPVTSFIIRLEELDDYPWSSHPEYLGAVTEGICERSLVEHEFPTRKTYTQFMYDQAAYTKTLASIGHLIIERAENREQE